MTRSAASHTHGRSRILLVTILAVALALAIVPLVGCGKKAAQPSGSASASPSLQITTAPAVGDVQQIVWDLTEGEPTTIDYVKSGDYATTTVVSNICDPLLRMAPDFSLHPAIAESWSNPDPKTIVFKIRQGVKFWDGQPLTAADVVYSMKRNMDPKTGSINEGYYTYVKSIEQTGTYEVTVHFTKPDELFIKEMAQMGGGIAEKAYVQRVGDQAFGTAKGGVMYSGPFKLVRWAPGTEIDLARNPNYWDPAYMPKAQKVVIKFINNESTLVPALMSGEIDGCYELPATTVQALKSATNGKIYLGPSWQFLDLMPAEGTMSNPVLRQALSMAIDKRAIVEKVYNGNAAPNKTLTPPTAWDPQGESIYKAAWDALPPTTQDIAGAKKLVASQPAVTKPIVLACLAGSQTELNIASIVQQAAKQIGLPMKIKQMQSLDFSNAFYIPSYRKGIDLMIALGYLAAQDPNDYLLYWFGPSALFNWTNYTNPTVQASVFQARQTYDAVKHAQLITEAQKIYTNDAIVIPICYFDEALFMNNRLTGATTSFAYIYTPSLAVIGAAK